jgi:hypothetical protein
MRSTPLVSSGCSGELTPRTSPRRSVCSIRRSRSGAALRSSTFATRSSHRARFVAWRKLHVIALEEHLAAKVELGNPEAVVPELQRLVDAFPFRERLRMQLMVALHRSGRSVEALPTYIEWRRILTDSWDIEPGPAIRQLWDASFNG